MMQSENRLIVLKFGSSVLRSENDLPTAVHEIYRWWRDGYQVVVNTMQPNVTTSVSPYVFKSPTRKASPNDSPNLTISRNKFPS